MGVDGSETRRAALRYAARPAGLAGVRLRPVQAYRPPTAYGTPVDCSDADFEKQARENLRVTVEGTLAEHPAVPVDPQVVEGHSAAVLTEGARETDLLVAGSPRAKCHHRDAPRAGRPVMTVRREAIGDALGT
ncbi:universal stress protein [Streptomyces galilaeus]